jgi:ribosome biogenesis GTPase A
MSIQWFPGHMTKARKAIAEAMPLQDVIIEVVDARMPRSSENPLIHELCWRKPRILVLCKSDLADPTVTAAWMRHYTSRSTEEHPRVPLALTTTKLNEIRTKIPALCKELAKHPRGPNKTVRAMIVGIPNVGKSTIANTLMGRAVAKVGNEPAVTKSKQQIVLASGMTLSDNPGLMWPKIENEKDGMRLGLGGAIAENALEFENLGVFAVQIIGERYPQALLDRYKLSALSDSPEATLREIGRKRGCLEKGGIVNLHKAGDAVIHDFRNGALGRLSLESPSHR